MKQRINQIIVICITILFILSSFLVSDNNKYYMYIQISMFAIAIIYLIFRLVQKNPIKLIKNKLDICILLLTISTMIPIISNKYVSFKSSILTVLQYIYAYIVYVLVRELSCEQKYFGKIIANILIVTTVIIVLVGLDGITANKLGNFLRTIGIKEFSNGEKRLISVFGYPNTLAVYISSILFLNINEYFHSNKITIKALYKTITFIFITGIILTYSKAIFAILPVSLILFILLTKDSNKRMEIIQNIIISFITAIIYIFAFDKLSIYVNYLIIWILFVVTVLINYLINLKSDELAINPKKLIIFIIIIVVAFAVYIAIGLNQYDKYEVFNDKEEIDYKTKIISNINGNTNYLFEFDIESKAPNDIDNTYSINLIERDDKNQEIKQTEIKFGTYNGEKQIDLKTNKSTKEIKIEFKSKYKYKNKKLVVKKLCINGKNTPLKYKYLPTKLVEKIQGISINYKTAKERIEMIKDALKLSKENLLTGIGGGGWQYKYSEVQSYNYIANEVHSYPAKIILEFGILGIIAYIGIIFVVISMLIRKKEHITILISFIVLVLHSMIDINMEHIHILIYMYLLLGMVSKELISEEKLSKLSYISNTAIIVTSLLCIYLVINPKVYDKYSCIHDAITNKNGLIQGTSEYEKANCEILKQYEEILDYERYNELNVYGNIIMYTLNSECENKLEKIEKCYEKILKYKNKSKANPDYIIEKMEIIDIIISRLEENSEEYDDIIEKFKGIIIDEYEKTKEEVIECLEKQYLEPSLYIDDLEYIYRIISREENI